MNEPVFDVAAAFRNKELAMKASFLAIRNVTTHPTTIGDHGEADWVGLIRDFLPTRYSVGPVFAVDCEGNMSEQIDAAVYDTHFSPQWFGTAAGVHFVPVESVYAVFEVKPEFSGKYPTAGRKKVASVRRLKRTSEAVVHKGGFFAREEIKPRPIIGGILTTRPKLANPVKKLVDSQPAPNTDSFLNIGICLDEFAFDYTPTLVEERVETVLDTCRGGNQLIHFAIRLFRQLQAIGTAPAVDMTKYEARVSDTNS